MRSPRPSGALRTQAAPQNSSEKHVPAGGIKCRKRPSHFSAFLPSFSTGLGHWVGSLFPLSLWFLFCCFPPFRLPCSRSCLGLAAERPLPIWTPCGPSFPHLSTFPDATLGSETPFETRAPALLKTRVPHPSGLGQLNLPGFPSPRELARGHSRGEGGKEGGIRAAVVERCQGQERGPAAVAGQEEKKIRQT